MMDRRNRNRLVYEKEEEERRAETERRGEELREAWRRNHPQEGEDREQDRRKRQNVSDKPLSLGGHTR